jgi:hypothetical protein
MTVCKRILAGLVLLLSVAGLLLSLAGGIGVWVVKEPVTAQATEIFGRIEAALDVADQGLAQVKSSLTRAEERLSEAREEQRKLAQQPQQTGVMRRLMVRTAQQAIAPEFNDELHNKLHTVAEAAVVVNAVLEDVGSFPFFSATGLDVDQLTQISNSLTQVESSAWRLSRLLGEPDPDSAAAGDQLSRMQRGLETVRRLVTEYEPQLTAVRKRTEELKAKLFFWITPAAVLVSVVCFWTALSQLSLMAHACSWWRRAGRNRPGGG